MVTTKSDLWFLRCFSENIYEFLISFKEKKNINLIEKWEKIKINIRIVLSLYTWINLVIIFLLTFKL